MAASSDDDSAVIGGKITDNGTTDNASLPVLEAGAIAVISPQYHDCDLRCTRVIEAGFDPNAYPQTYAAFHELICQVAFDPDFGTLRTIPALEQSKSIVASLCVLWIRDAPKALGWELEDTQLLVPRLVYMLTGTWFHEKIERRLRDNPEPEKEIPLCRFGFYEGITKAMGLDGPPAWIHVLDRARIAEQFYPAIIEEKLMTANQLGLTLVKAARV